MTLTDEPTAPPVPAAAPRRPPGDAALRAIAAFKLCKTAGLIVLGIGLARLIGHDGPGEREAARALIDRVPHGSHGHLVHRLLAEIRLLPPTTLKVLAVGAFVYAGLYAVEGAGLLLRRRWAEWMVVVTTALLLPVEVYELARKPNAVRAAVFVLNAATVAYLVWRLRRERTIRRGPTAGAATAP
ncbi:MAG: hypothetical protein JWO31_2184 [Phycisphaerales bacterium]|nr:hypothetical protein [Phycisphaerales bacterium]